MAERTFATREGLELSPGTAPAIAALADAWPRSTRRRLGQFIARLAAADKLRLRPYATQHTTLRGYQYEGHAWLARMAAWGAGVCLADDTGLSETVQAIG